VAMWLSITQGAMWVAAVALALWFPCLALPFGVGPITRGTSGLSPAERVAAKTHPKVAAFPLPRVTLTVPAGPRWNRLVEAHGADAARMRRSYDALFLPARLTALTVFAAALVFLVPGLVLLPGASRVLVVAAVVATSGVPFVLTMQASRSRWRRRAPFEYRLVDEGQFLLRQRRRRPLGPDRTEILGELDDLMVVARSRYDHDLPTAATTLAEQTWQQQLSPLVASLARNRLEPLPRSTDNAVPAAFLPYLEGIADLTRPSTRPWRRLRPLPRPPLPPRRRLESSADRAGVSALVFTGVVLAAAVLAVWSEAPPNSPWWLDPAVAGISTTLNGFLGIIIGTVTLAGTLIRRLTRRPN